MSRKKAPERILAAAGPKLSREFDERQSPFWQGRRVFLTGHTGFKGSWLSLWLNALGADVTGYALDPPTQPSLFEQARVAGKLRDRFAATFATFARLEERDGRVPSRSRSPSGRPVGRAPGYDDPIENYASNVMGTVHVLEAVRQLKLPCAVVNVTSDKCYDNREWIWGYREDEPMGGHDPYSNSKGCAELVTSAYRDSFFSPGAIADHGVALGSARAGNAIGGGDWTSHQLIPDLMRAFLEGQPCLIRNPSAYPALAVCSGAAARIPDACRASRRRRPALSLRDGTSAPSTPTSSRFPGLPTNSSACGAGAAWALDSAAHPHEAHALKLDAAKAAAGLHWRPVLSLKQALAWIADWYKGFKAGADLQQLTLQQIVQYEALARDAG